MRETEQIVARIMADSDKRSVEADRLKNELLKARLAEKDAKEKLLQFLSCEPERVVTVMSPPTQSVLPPAPEIIIPATQYFQQQAHARQPSQTRTAVPSVPPPLPLTLTQLPPPPPEEKSIDLDPITLEIEKERVEYLEKSKNLQEQLKELKTEIRGFKLEEKEDSLDVLHQEQVQSGENKYSTLRKVSGIVLAFRTLELRFIESIRRDS